MLELTEQGYETINSRISQMQGFITSGITGGMSSRQALRQISNQIFDIQKVLKKEVVIVPKPGPDPDAA